MSAGRWRCGGACGGRVDGDVAVHVGGRVDGEVAADVGAGWMRGYGVGKSNGRYMWYSALSEQRYIDRDVHFGYT